MSANRSPIEMIIMRALTISLPRVLRQIGRGLAAFSLMALVVAPLSAQTFRGTILGTVLDPNGAVVPGAKVTAKNVETGIERTTATDDQGNYTIAELQTGSYE
ncbi:MAG TPA: carboxypeptidase-like regulatory domain-containing protein, partial [Pyrinomonadaceae bacterium]|nr:carboxypeptidase-like regulatory domain-containing protein [Pyrinomonadaceae bacterium]